MSDNERVSVTIVTYNSGRFIKRCLESVLAQRYANREIIVIDNASTDGTVDILEQFEDRCQIIYNDENIGFAAAQNQAIRAGTGTWVLTLNPDVLLLPNFIQAMVEGGQLDPQVGAVCGKLLAILASFDLPDKPLVDSQAFTSRRCCVIWIAAARKWTTAITCSMSMCSAQPRPRPYTAGR